MIDWQILAAVTALAICTGLASGIAPALSASQVDIAETIKTGSQRSTSGFWTGVRSLIISGEVALTLVLLVSAGLLTEKSLQSCPTRTRALIPRTSSTVRISPQSDSPARSARLASPLYDRLLERTSSIPGVQAAAVTNSVPLDGQLPTIAVDVEGHPKTDRASGTAVLVWTLSVRSIFASCASLSWTGGYLSRSDGPRSAGVVVISAATAKRFWPNQSAIGKHIKSTGGQDWRTVVGVVGDVHQSTLSEGLPAFVPGAIYMPYPQAIRQDGQIPASMTLLARAQLGQWLCQKRHPAVGRRSGSERAGR